MVRTFLVCGMLVGIVAGLLSFAFLKIYGEPQVDRAVAFETQQDEAKAAAQKTKSHNHASAPHDHASEAHAHVADHDEPELVSRSVQAGLACSSQSSFTAPLLVGCLVSHSRSLMGVARAR